MNLLLRVQFRENLKYRMAVLSIIPLTMFYGFLSLFSGGMSDPFLDASNHAMQSLVLYMGIGVIPFLLHAGVSVSESPEAAWIIRSAPITLTELALALADRFIWRVMVPLHVLLMVYMVLVFHNSVNGLIHGLHIFLLNVIVLYSRFLVRPLPPFSQPVGKTSQSSRTLGVLLLLPLLYFAYLESVLSLIYPHPTILGIYFVMLIVIVLGFRHWAGHSGSKKYRYARGN